jgi:hypothetical protein
LATRDERSAPSPVTVQTLFPYEPTAERAIFSDDVWLSNAQTLLRLTHCPLGLYECAQQCFAAGRDDLLPVMMICCMS